MRVRIVARGAGDRGVTESLRRRTTSRRARRGGRERTGRRDHRYGQRRGKADLICDRGWARGLSSAVTVLDRCQRGGRADADLFRHSWRGDNPVKANKTSAVTAIKLAAIN